MAEISKIRRCYSCGVILQSEDSNKEGFVKKEVLDNTSQNFIFCDKCFEKERYRITVNEPPLNPELLQIINDGKSKNGLFVYVVNLFSFEAAFNSELSNALKGTRILVVGNKFDLLPVGTDKDLICEYVAHRFRVAGLSLKASDVILTNSFDDKLTKEVMTRIYELKDGKNVYIVGSQLSGRNTIISSFLRIFKNNSHGNIVTEPYPNTKTDILKVPFNSKTAIYSLPGIGLENSILYKLDRSTLHDIYLTKPVRPRDVSLSANQSLFIGGLAFIELLEGKRTLFTCYFHNHVTLKKTHLSNKNADERFVQLVNKKILKPVYSHLESVKDLDVYELTITESGLRDIGIMGLGWISFMANSQKIRVYVPKGISIYQTRAKINR